MAKRRNAQPSEAPKANKRVAAQVDQDRAAFVKLFVRGWSQREMVEWIKKNRPYELSRSQIAADLAHVLEEWKDERLTARDGLIKKQLMKLQQIESELWEAWEKSKGEAVTTESKSQLEKGGKQQPIEAKVRKESRVGDVMIMRAILDAQKMIHELLGLNAPRRLAVEREDGAGVQAVGMMDAIDVDTTPRVVLYLPKNGREVEETKDKQ